MTSVKMTSESTSGSIQRILQNGEMLSDSSKLPGESGCSDDEQINRDLLQLRKHLALLATNPSK